jgi:DNA-binding transcriptional regulator YhcF (GntR family)
VEPVVIPRITVDLGLPVAPYEQIRAQLADLIRAGRVPGNERLPPVRQLAADLGLAAGTVARAYRELEQAGLLTSRRGGGTRVSPGLAEPPERRRQGLLEERANDLIGFARRIGASDAETLSAVQAALRVAAPDGDASAAMEQSDANRRDH